MEESKAKLTVSLYMYTVYVRFTVLFTEFSTTYCEKPRDVMLLQNSVSLLSQISLNFISGSVDFGLEMMNSLMTGLQNP